MIACSAALAVVGCGSDDPRAADPTLSGVVRDPAPAVDLVALPSLTEPGTDVEFRADEGELQIVYFGFTNCPDVCPTTLADLSVALRILGEERAADVQVVMVGIDPERDNPVLADYVTAFNMPDAIAAGTDDTELLQAAAEPFGASWNIITSDDGSVDVEHSAFLYAVDADGRLALSWQFGAAAEDIANDIGLLLDRAST